MKYTILFLFFGYLALTDGYVLLQMRKNANNSDVDAVIHKKVPGDKFDKLAKRMSRKQLRMQSENSEEESSETTEVQKESGHPLVLGVNTGAVVDGKRSQGIEELLQIVKNTFQGEEPFFRSKTFEFSDISGSPRSKSSLGVELDTQALLQSVKNFVSSRKFKRTAEDIARKAAVIFRALRDDL